MVRSETSWLGDRQPALPSEKRKENNAKTSLASSQDNRAVGTILFENLMKNKLKAGVEIFTNVYGPEITLELQRFNSNFKFHR